VYVTQSKYPWGTEKINQKEHLLPDAIFLLFIASDERIMPIKD
jgi:hypothetical protein